MPRGIYNRNKQAVVNKKIAKKAANKAARKTKVVDDHLASTPHTTVKTVKAEIIDTLEKFHVAYEDKDGHIAIRNTQMLDRFTITELLENGVQILNARKDETGTYIAIYY